MPFTAVDNVNGTWLLRRISCTFNFKWNLKFLQIHWRICEIYTEPYVWSAFTLPSKAPYSILFSPYQWISREFVFITSSTETITWEVKTSEEINNTTRIRSLQTSPKNGNAHSETGWTDFLSTTHIPCSMFALCGLRSGEKSHSVSLYKWTFMCSGFNARTAHKISHFMAQMSEVYNEKKRKQHS